VRRQIVGALTPHVLKAMEPDVVALVDSLLDRMGAQRDVDLIADYAAAVPVEVIGNLLRVPRQDRAPLRGCSLAILGALEPAPTAAQLTAGNRAVTEFCAYLHELIAQRRRRPAGDDDLLTRLVGDDQLTVTELAQNCVFLLNAGHETTTNLIGNGLHLFLTHRDSLQRLRQEPELIASAVEECLRFESSNQLGNRLVVQRTVVREVVLEPGTYLTLCIGAANRDPDEFTDPDRFDIARQPNRHLAFAAGAHACAGMAVARLEGRVAIARALQRFPQMQLSGEPVRGRRARFRGFAALPVRVD
jgi:cytochrome P450